MKIKGLVLLVWFFCHEHEAEIQAEKCKYSLGTLVALDVPEEGVSLGFNE
jgi:hypothetical protein